MRAQRKLAPQSGLTAFRESGCRRDRFTDGLRMAGLQGLYEVQASDNPSH